MGTLNPNVISPGQTRGWGIEGGTMHGLTKGDIIAIPQAKTPHQWKDTSKTGSVCYYAVNSSVAEFELAADCRQ